MDTQQVGWMETDGTYTRGIPEIMCVLRHGIHHTTPSNKWRRFTTTNITTQDHDYPLDMITTTTTTEVPTLHLLLSTYFIIYWDQHGRLSAAWLERVLGTTAESVRAPDGWRRSYMGKTEHDSL